MRPALRHRHVDVEGIPIHAVEAGSSGSPSVLFLHGWPQSWAAFKPLMISLGSGSRVVAIDLPGIGDSRTPPAASDKRTLARYVRGLIRALRLRDVTLVGHDVGGMIVYAYLHAHPDDIARAVIMNTVIPGIDPWFEVKRNPNIWHFGFHAVPELPERLVAERQAAYFAFFYDTIAATPGAVGPRARRTYVDAYARPDALHAGFEWYRAFAQDEKDNLGQKDETVETPVLYLRGERERGDLDRYVRGLRDSGLSNVRGRVLANSGHFAMDERPDEVLGALRSFIGLTADPEPRGARPALAPHPRPR